jgi:hypothetical protein
MLTFVLGTVSSTLAQETHQYANKEDARVLADFTARVKKYVELVDKVDAGAPPLKETKDPAKISVAQDALAERIRAARAGAKRGELFTPEIEKTFRSLLRPEVKGKDGAPTKEKILEEKPKELLRQINGKYPEKEPLSTVPPNVLESLPKLPEQVDYRFVGKDLILRDARANIIVDYIPNAIP